MKASITPEDVYEAIEARYARKESVSCTCVVAQTLKRVFGGTWEVGILFCKDKEKNRYLLSNQTEDLVLQFDYDMSGPIAYVDEFLLRSLERVYAHNVGQQIEVKQVANVI